MCTLKKNNSACIKKVIGFLSAPETSTIPLWPQVTEGCRAEDVGLSVFVSIFFIPLPGTGCWCLKNFQTSSQTIITIWPAGNFWWRWGSWWGCRAVSLIALESLPGKSGLRAPYIPTVPGESLQWLEGRIFVFEGKSKKLGAEKTERPALKLHGYTTRLWNLCSRVYLFNEPLCGHQVLAARWVRGPGIFLLSKTSSRMTEAKPAIPHPVFGPSCMDPSAVFSECLVSADFWTIGR